MRLFRDEYSGFRIDSTVFVRYRDVRVIPRHFVFCIRMISREFPAHCWHRFFNLSFPPI